MAPRGEQSRQHILDAAEDLMAHDGYAAVSIARLEEASGLPASSIYWHFGSKEGVLLAVMERGAEAFFATLTRIEETDGSPQERVDAIFREMARHLGEHPLFLRLLITVGLQRTASEEATAVVDHIRTAGLVHAREISRVVADAADRDVDERTIDAMGRMMMALADGLVFAVQVGDPIDLERMLAWEATMLRALVESEGRPRRPVAPARRQNAAA